MNASPFECLWTNDQGALVPQISGDEGPWLFEDVAYHLHVEAPTGTEVELRHRTPELLSNIRQFSGHSNQLAGVVNFRRQVGISEFLVVLDGEPRFRFTVEVFPTKLDYFEDYEQLLAEVAAASRALALDYLKATSRYGDALTGEKPAEIEWLLLLRHVLQDLEGAMRHLNSHPHRKLMREVAFVHLDKLRKPTTETYAALRKRQGQGRWIPFELTTQARERLPVRRAYETLDTPEHRWLRQNLSVCLRRLAKLRIEISSQLEREESSGRSASADLRRQFNDVIDFETRVSKLTDLEVLSESTKPPPPAFSSLTLLSRSGYREAYRSLVLLRQGLSLQGESLELSVKDLALLYEIWCFMRMGTLLRDEFRTPVDASELFRLTGSGLRIELVRGQQSRLKFSDGLTTASLFYNRSFPGLTGDQRPDIVLEIERRSWPPLHVAFDAKYRLDASPEFRARFASPGPPVDAVNQLHRYRDAIVHSTASRHVVKGAALFPLDSEASLEYHESKLWKSLYQIGIGAMPFLPGNTEFVSVWIRQLLTSSTWDLAEPGPPQAGLIHKTMLTALSHEPIVLVSSRSRQELETYLTTPLFQEEIPAQRIARIVIVEQTEQGVRARWSAPVRGIELIPTTQRARAAEERIEYLALARRSRVARVPVRFRLGDWTERSPELRGHSWPFDVAMISSNLAWQVSQTIEELGLRSVRHWALADSLNHSGLEFKTVISTGWESDVDADTQFKIQSHLGQFEVRLDSGGYRIVLPSGDTTTRAHATDVLLVVKESLID